MKKVVLLGSTGSIGTSTIKVAEDLPEQFQLIGLAAGNNVELLLEQTRRHKPAAISVTDPAKAKELSNILGTACQVYSGNEGLLKLATMSDADIVATFTALTARSLALNYKLHLPEPPETVVLAGGGASNRTLRAAIETELQRLNPRAVVRGSEELGWPVQSIEPAAFALLAWMRIHRLPGNLPEKTGAKRAVLLGQVSEN